MIGYITKSACPFPEYMAKLDRIEKKDTIVIGSPSGFRKRYGI
ncbi:MULTISPECIES: hypothetical protein [unclassified Methanosarcina]|nr:MULTISPECIES: hypothetical protein [unclassified Methanosarcina]